MHTPTLPNGNTSLPSPSAARGAGPQATAAGRDSHGRFGKGNGGGPGNPFARQVAALRCALLAAVTQQDMEEITQVLVRQAKEGNHAAAKLLFSYTLGKPAAPVGPDTLDQQEWEIYRRTPDPGLDLAAMPGRMPLPLACRMARDMLPALDRDWTRQSSEGFQKAELEEQREAAAREERRRRRRDRSERLSRERPSDAAPPSANGPDGRDRPSAPARPPSANRAFGPDGPERGGAADVAACNPRRPPG